MASSGIKSGWPLWGCAVALLSGLLWIGCSTHSAPSAAGGKGKTTWTPHQEMLAEADMEQRVRTAAHFATGLSYELNDKADLALDEFVRAARSNPTEESVVIEAARRCIREQKPEKTAEAIDLLQKATAAPEASGTLFTWLGLAYAQAGKTDQAIIANRTAIKRMPQGLAAYQNLAQIYLQTSRTNDALQILDDAARQPTDNPGYLIELADLFLRYGRSQSSPSSAVTPRIIELLDRAADLNPVSPVQLLRLADDYYSLSEFKKAEPFYKKLLDEHPDLPSLRGKLTDIYLRSGQKGKASEQLEELAKNEPTNPQAYVFLGALNAEEKKYAEAAENFERAIKLDPDLEQVYFDLVSIKLMLKKAPDALALLEKARSRFKLSFPLEFYTGVTYVALKNYSEALKYLISAEAVAKATDPSRLNQLFYFQLGSTYERNGNLVDAEKYFREALKLAPEDPETLNYLGYMWAEKGVHLEEAHRNIEKAVQQEPDNAAFLDSLGWVLFKLGRPKEALAPIEKAVEKSDEPDATLLDHLGDIHAALHQVDQARDAWTKALAIEANPQIQQKLKDLASPAPP